MITSISIESMKNKSISRFQG